MQSVGSNTDGIQLVSVHSHPSDGLPWNSKQHPACHRKKPKQIAEAKIGINSTNKNIINNKQKDISYRTNSTNKNIKWWTTVVVTSGLSEFLSSLS